MYDDADLDFFERYLETAPILDVAAWAQHGAHTSYRVVLRGGVGALAKPENEIADGLLLVRREAAAWVLARELGWADLMAATVVRKFESPSSRTQVDASVQVIWPDVQPDADVHAFLEWDTWRAALFDFLVGHTDRGGHNWLALPNQGRPPQLKLIDHGYGFGDGVFEPNSTFFQLHRGDELPHEMLNPLKRLGDPRLGSALAALLPPSAIDGVRQRADRLNATRRLGI